jgi:hypothetical protein
MATAIGGDWPTLLDVQTRLDHNGATPEIVEMLQQTNEVLLDAPWFEGNLPTGHQVTQRTGLPAVYYRRMNQGVPHSKSTTAQITFAASMLEAMSKIDVRLVELNGKGWMMTEEAAFAEAMNQQLAESIIYGSVGNNVDEFSGLATMYSDLTTAASKANILDAGGTGSDLTSIWLVTWGQHGSHMFYPKGTQGALQYEDLGQHIATDDAGLEFMAFRGHWKMRPGFCVANWQANSRIANIDVSNIVNESSPADILKLMTKAVHKVPKHILGKKSFLVNRTVFTMLDIQAQNKSNVYLTVGEEEGRPKVSFRGIPIRTVDQITDAETRVV